MLPRLSHPAILSSLIRYTKTHTGLATSHCRHVSRLHLWRDDIPARSRGLRRHRVPLPQLRQLLCQSCQVETVVYLLLCRMYSSATFPPSHARPSTDANTQPVIPLSMHGYEDVTCSICNFAQPLEHRQDVQQMRGGGGQGVPLQNTGPYPPGPPPGPQGWGGGPPVDGPPGPNKPMNYR